MAKPAPAAPKRSAQWVQTYRMAKATDPLISLWSLLALLGGAVVGGAAFWLLPPRDMTIVKVVLIVLGMVSVGAIAGMIVFTRRAQRAAFRQMDGKPGAAAAALGMLRRGWKVDQMVALNRHTDLVHRAVGPPGIVLVGEGHPGRLKSLLAAERKKHERVASGTPIHEVVVGEGDGQVTLNMLVRSVLKLPKKVRPAEITDLMNRLKAIYATRSAVPLPKGPVRTSMKGQRGNLRGR
jgi:hypothetical protein